ncbi:dynein regulatory complex subunit 4 [Aulostomus maculatus]
MQPPKSKKSPSKKPAKTKTTALIDGLTKDELSKEKMIEHIVQLREELDREREERNYFQLERDKMYAFREITERRREEATAELKNLNKETEEDERRHQVEIKVYKQKMKHLLCEHENMTSELKADGLSSIERLQREQTQLENELRKRMGDIRLDMQELDIENLVRELELKHDEDMKKTRNNWENQLTEVQAEYEKKMELMQQEVYNMRRTETSEREDLLNSHITALKGDHDRIFSEAVALLNQSVEQDLEVNDSLKKQIEDMKLKQKEKEKNLAGLLPDNKCLDKLLLKVTEEMAEVQKKIKHPTQEKQHPDENSKEQKLNNQIREFEVLKQKYSELQLERDELYKTFTQNIQTVQHRADLKNVPMEKKLTALTDSLEKTQAQLSSVLSAANLDQTALSRVTKKIQDIIDTSNKSIKDLQYKRARISKAHQELLLHYELKQIPGEGLCGN